MARIVNGDQVLAFADTSDVQARDQRVFEANEGLTDEVVDDACISATSRILVDIQRSAWWQNLFTRLTSDLTPYRAQDGLLTLPQPEAARVTGRADLFRDLCVNLSLSEYVLPQIADFGNPDSAERQKMAYYRQRYDQQLQELLDLGDWYDFDDDGTVELGEKEPMNLNFVRRR